MMQKETSWKKGLREILVFSVGGEELGLELDCVREVLKDPKVHRLPRTPDFVEGVISLRGHLIALFDLRKRLLVGEVEGEPGRKIIICKAHKFLVGLAVAGLREIITPTEEEIQPLPELALKEGDSRVFRGLVKMDGKVIPILNLEQVITKNEMAEASGVEG
jgi:purine-binding chemotaxis protein CheW